MPNCTIYITCMNISYTLVHNDDNIIIEKELFFFNNVIDNWSNFGKKSQSTIIKSCFSHQIREKINENVFPHISSRMHVWIRMVIPLTLQDDKCWLRIFIIFSLFEGRDHSLFKKTIQSHLFLFTPQINCRLKAHEGKLEKKGISHNLM